MLVDLFKGWRDEAREMNIQGTGLSRKKWISNTASGYGRFKRARFAYRTLLNACQVMKVEDKRIDLPETLGRA